MGWLYMQTTQKELVKRLTQTEQNGERIRSTINHVVIPEADKYVLWSVERIEYTVGCPEKGYQAGDALQFITCALLDCSGNQWGYKLLCEEMHPYYYSCPLSFLEMATDHTCEAWRKQVQQFHLTQQQADLHLV